MDATTVAVDVAKTVFEIAIANRQGHIIARHRFNRRQFARFLATTPATHVVMEACGTAHFWGRCAHQHGHAVSLLPPAYVRPYVRRNKTDRTDAEALLEAMRDCAVVFHSAGAYPHGARQIDRDVQGALAQIRNGADIQARRLPQIGAWIAAHPASQRGAR